MSSTATSGRNLRPVTASSSGMAKLASLSLAVSTRHASGGPVATHTSWWGLSPEKLPAERVLTAERCPQVASGSEKVLRSGPPL